MSNTSEYESEEESSQDSSEYHSGQESEPDRTQIILVNREEEFTFLNIQFPMPSPYPHPYIQLKELMTTVTTAPESYHRITDDESTYQILSYGLLFLTFYRFSIHRRSSDIYRTDATFSDLRTNLRTIATDYTLYSSHHRSGTTSETSHMTYGPHRYIFLS